jgi:hypothetical protein
MFTSQEIIGDIIYVSLKDKERYRDIGIQDDGHFYVLGYDNFGIWVKHPKLILSTNLDSEGKPLPPKNIIHEKIESNFLITWDNINTLMHYPDREGFDFPSEFNKKYGFKIDKNG